jgi:hypothetical protein
LQVRVLPRSQSRLALQQVFFFNTDPMAAIGYRGCEQPNEPCRAHKIDALWGNNLTFLPLFSLAIVFIAQAMIFIAQAMVFIARDLPKGRFLR